jgi:uncharacterized protein (DUF983 family)
MQEIRRCETCASDTRHTANAQGVWDCDVCAANAKRAKTKADGRLMILIALAGLLVIGGGMAYLQCSAERTVRRM